MTDKIISTLPIVLKESLRTFETNKKHSAQMEQIEYNYSTERNILLLNGLFQIAGNIINHISTIKQIEADIKKAELDYNLKAKQMDYDYQLKIKQMEMKYAFKNK